MSRRTPSWWFAAAIPAVTAAALVLAATNAAAAPEPASPARSLPSGAVANSAAAGQKWYNGVALPAAGDLQAWQRRTGEKPKIISLYINLTNPFPLAQVKTIIADGALPLIQIDPRNDSLNRLKAGRYNKQLTADRKSIMGLHHKVAVSFGHEMNGVWSDWGCGHVSPSTFRAAWRHVHSAIGTQDVTWVWNPGHQSGRCKIAPWYPGSRYVNWIGIDGYLRNAKSAFGPEFNATIEAARHLAPGKPIFLAETACPVSARMVKQLRGLYAGAHRSGMIGLVWFDGVTALGNYHPWKNGAFLRAFKRLIA